MKDDNLFSLVKTMNKAEKRSFKIYLSKYNLQKEINAIVLFDAIEVLDEFDKNLLIKNLEGYSFVKNLNYEKHRLQQLILNFFIDFHKENHIEIELRNLLNKVHILVEKNILPLALKLVNKGITDSKNNYYPKFTYEFLSKKMMIIQSLSSKKEDFSSVLEEYDEYFSKIENEHHFHLLYRKFVSQHITKDLSPKSCFFNEDNWLEQSELFQETKPATTKVGMSYLYHTKYLYHTLKGEQTKVFGNIQKAKDLFEENPGYLKGYFRNYLSICFSYIRASMVTKQYDLAGDMLKNMKSFPTKYEDRFTLRLENYYHSYYYGYLINWYRTLYRFEEAYKLFESKADFLFAKNFFNYSYHRGIEFRFNKIAIAFGLGKNQEVVESLRAIEKLPNKEIKPEHFYYSKMIGIFANYELKYTTMVVIEISRLQEYRKRKIPSNKTNKFELKVLKALKKNIDTMDIREILLPFEEEAHLYLNDGNGDNLFPLWFKAKINSLNIKDVLKLKRKEMM